MQVDWHTFGLSLVPLVGLAQFYVKRYFRRFNEEVDLTVQTVLITNAETQLGRALGLEFAKRNARVILACRSMIEGGLARLDIVANSGRSDRNVLARILDMRSLDGVRDFADLVLTHEERLDILVNIPAHIGFPSPQPANDTTKFYNENYLGPFLLTTLLLDLLKKSGAQPCIVHVGSFLRKTDSVDLDYLKSGEEISFDKIMQTKPMLGQSRVRLHSNVRTMRAMFTSELARRVSELGITVCCTNPGKDPDEGTQILLHCALSRTLQSDSVHIFSGWQKDNVHDLAKNSTLCEKFWKYSETLIREFPNDASDSQV